MGFRGKLPVRFRPNRNRQARIFLLRLHSPQGRFNASLCVESVRPRICVRFFVRVPVRGGFSIADPGTLSALGSRSLGPTIRSSEPGRRVRRDCGNPHEILSLVALTWRAQVATWSADSGHCFLKTPRIRPCWLDDDIPAADVSSRNNRNQLKPESAKVSAIILEPVHTTRSRVRRP